MDSYRCARQGCSEYTQDIFGKIVRRGIFGYLNSNLILRWYSIHLTLSLIGFHDPLVIVQIKKVPSTFLIGSDRTRTSHSQRRRVGWLSEHRLGGGGGGGGGGRCQRQEAGLYGRVTRRGPACTAVGRGTRADRSVDTQRTGRDVRTTGGTHGSAATEYVHTVSVT